VSFRKRTDIYRAKAAGCDWACEFVRRDDTRQLLRTLGAQWRALAEQLEFLERVTGSDRRNLT
jgi:hypothetical protein